MGGAGGHRGPAARYWNGKRLAAELTRRDIWPLGHHAVDRLLADLGTARPSVRREHGPAYERDRPNELWHIDIKGPFFLQRSRGEYTKVWIVGLVANHSRFLVGLRVLPRPGWRPSSSGSTSASSCAGCRAS